LAASPDAGSQGLTIPVGAKYALLCLRTGADLSSLPDFLDLGSGFFCSRGLPLELPDHWSEWLGSIKVERLGDSNLVLAVVQPSENPRVLDKANDQLCRALRRFYIALVIASPFFEHSEATVLTGGRTEDQLNVRELFEYERIRRPGGCSPHAISVRTLRAADAVLGGIVRLETAKQFDRTLRLTRAFMSGKRSIDVAEALHQYVRCLEGLILPRTGDTKKQFKHRTQVFIGPHSKETVALLFDIRSFVEHLHHPLDAMDCGRCYESYVSLYRCARQAEALARYCLERLLSTPELRDHFQSDEAIAAFWKLPMHEQQKLWGSTLDIGAVLDEFDEDSVKKQWGAVANTVCAT